MAAISAEGIVLRKYFLRETSYILVVFTRRYGKIRGVLKGVRDPYPQFAGNFEIFTRVNLLFYKKKKSKMDLITRCEAEDFFLHVRKDLERLTYANYFIELVDVVTSDHDPNETLFDVLLESLRLLSTSSSPRRAARIFEIKLLDSIGLSLKVDKCYRCSRDADEGFRFSITEGSVICPACLKRPGGHLTLSLGTLNFIGKIQAVTIDKAQKIKVERSVGKELEEVLKKFIQYHVGRRLRSMEFLEKIGKKVVLQKA